MFSQDRQRAKFSYHRAQFVQIAKCLLFVILIIHVCCNDVESARVRHQSPSPKQAQKFLKGIGVTAKNKQTTARAGIWPPVLNLATKAVISVNATCGEGGREEFCRMHDGPTRPHLIELVNGGNEHHGRCGVCDNFSRDPHKRHPINYAIDDGTNRWWQSPPIFYGLQYEYVTITIDLKQVYQVVYVKLKSANSPRPGAWILERSVDGRVYEAWQYFATSEKDCLDRYGVPARKGKPHYFTDTEVICTSYYSKLAPMENGEIYTLLVHGRPGANETSPELLQFTKARYVRFRFQGLRGKVEPLPARFAQDINRDRKLFYSIRDILIGGQCVCHGHASACRHKLPSGNLECECAHNTCGPNCDHCCPLFNQVQWGAGTSRDAHPCVPCQCYGHAESCHYDEDVARQGLSLNTEDEYKGGGVCENCTKFTTGINCEKCIPGYYRPFGTPPDAEMPCSKCDCDLNGSTGECSLESGTLLKCQCRPGYTGLRCDSCDSGYRGYPNCEKCPCNQRGSLIKPNFNCEGECICKINVEGTYCDRCKVGFFSLQQANPEGCSACYCSGVTSVCASAYLEPQIFAFSNENKWLVTDISVNEIETPSLDDRDMLTVGNNEIIGIESYYWLAPTEYTGNKLNLYGSNILYKVHWVVMRGDTSGKPTIGPNIILVGKNGMRIACGDDQYTGNNMTFLLPLDDYQETWYHIPDDVDDIVTRLRRTEYRGDRVTRHQFMSVLLDLKHILLRAKFHTDQIEVSLEEVVIYSGNFTDGYSPIEECSCPSGYTGLSCELCQYGYVRIMGNNTKHEQQEFCVKCDCNGHSATCNADSGECECEHHTIGAQCERCAPGFYGNPLRGTPEDCKRCACPLVDEENNFSPGCQLDASSINNDDIEPGYVCTQCPRGYTGDHCEICDDGFFGSPSIKGGKCEPCPCGGGPCDRITGQCLSCRGNTEGWKCEKCKEGFFGNPSDGCEPCLCDTIGSTSTICNNVTGECSCNDHFIGRTCNKCEIGYGNVTAKCVACNCDPVGAISEICDQTTGMCECHPGVEGFRCDACQHLFYGFSNEGCTSCNCSIRGSELTTCNIVTGQCRCRQNYIGLTCNQCKEGHYESAYGCAPCDCHEEGSESSNCHPTSGQCTCKPGVEGHTCNKCKKGYYGFSKFGCKECESCIKPGHICDQETGRCACPPHSHGELCDHCKPNHWGFKPLIGCKNCNCSDTGAIRLQCNQHTGICICNQGYSGFKCEQCAHGYYGYPKCRRCNCYYPGTDNDRGSCDSTSGVCQCDDEGNCPCKANVIGKRCNKCRESTFGLHLENRDGCTECFCFGRSNQCEEAGYTWSKIRMRSRTLTVDFIDNSYLSNQVTPLILDTNNFQEIEGAEQNVSISHGHFPIPLYWRLPYQYNNDRILSYGGYLKFTVVTTPHQEYQQFSNYPIARIEGNGLKLIHYSPVSSAGRYEIHLHETKWRLEKIHGFNTEFQTITRDVFMVTLQRVTGIFLKATDYNSFESLILKDVTLDSGVKVLGNPPPLAMGIEQCICPKEYNGTSCQNPSLGYYRSRIGGVYHGPELIDNVIGKAIPCSCNGRSKICDIETGNCFNCSQNTSGFSCEDCAEGYYGNPSQGKCQSCACPSVERNFAISCVPNSRGNHFSCNCKPGYYGPTCDRCSNGYYGQPHLPGGSCKPCNCNIDGSRTTECDSLTGKCSCKPGIVGEKCNECSQERHILQNNTCVLCDDCIQILLDDLDKLKYKLHSNTQHLNNGTLQPPWGMLDKLEAKYLNLSEDVDKYLTGKDAINEVYDKKEIDAVEKDVYNLKDNFNEWFNKSTAVQNLTKTNKHRSNDILEKAELTKQDLQSIKTDLSKFATDHVSTKDALKQAQVLYQNIKKQRGKMNIKVGKIKRQCEDAHRNVLHLTKSMKLHELEALKTKYQHIIDTLKDLDKLLINVTHKIEIGALKNSKNSKYLQVLQNVYKDMHENMTKILSEHNANNEILQEAKNILNSSAIADYEEINQLVSDLDDRISDEFIDNISDKRQQLEKHVQNLTKNARHFEEIYAKATKNLDQLKISKKFGDTLDLIEQARFTYEEADDTFDELLKDFLEPEDGDTLHDNSSISEAASERLQKRISVLKTSLENDITQKQKHLEIDINGLKQLNWDNGLANNNQMEKIHDLKLDKGKAKDIEDVIRAAVDSLEKSRQIHKDATDLNITKKYNLDKAWDKYLNLTSAENIRRFQDNMRFTKEMLKNVSNYDGAATNIDVLNQHKIIIERFNHSKAGIEEKLAKLKSNILKAKQLASTISIPLSGSSCGRKLKIPNFESSTKFLLKMDFTYDHNDINEKKIFFALKLTPDSYIKLISDNTLKLIVKREDKEDEEVCPLKISKSSKDLLKLTLTEETATINKENSNCSFALPSFEINRNILEVGLDEDDSRTVGLPGCIKELTINKRPIGLWNFVETYGECKSCSVIKREFTTGQTYKFNGDSFIAIKGLNRKYKNPSEISIYLQIRTFDEDAMLMLIYADGPYIAITLKNGHVQFEMHYSEEVKVKNKVIYKSTNKINNGQEVDIKFNKKFVKRNNEDHVTFEVSGNNNGYWINEVAPQSLIKILRANFFIGGLPPDFDTKNLNEGTTTTPFLGVLSGTLIEQPISIEEPNYQIYNVDYFRENQISFDIVLLEDKSSRVKLKVKRSTSLSSISFVVKVLANQETGDILTIGDPRSTSKSNIVFKLYEGKLQISRAGESITFDQINDNMYHPVKFEDNCICIDCYRQTKKICLKPIAEKYKNLEIQIGGENSFVGVFKELKIDSEYIMISPETYVSHTRAKIGRTLPVNYEVETRAPKIIGDMSMKDMSPTTCEKALYDFETNAYKFGDTQDSYIGHELKNGFWKSNYSIEFALRTLYSDGLLLLGQGNNHYNMLLIENGFIGLHIKGRKDVKKIATAVKVDDGKWHRVVIENINSLRKRRRKLSLYVDDIKYERKMPQNKITNQLHIGNVPKYLSKEYSVQQFRGCLRSLRINQLTPNLFDKKTQSVRIGQCFSSIERGTYFRGDSYVIYDKNFKFNEQLDVAFDFRTDQQNGVLLSIADVANRPALSIELQNGAVVMSVDMGNGIITNVTNNLAKNSACNNEWHKVVASFSTELSVRVDDVIQSWVLNGLENFTPIEAPLYIGGLPDFAPGGTLKIKENFKGCIRNLSIHNKLKDWIDMHELVKVSLNSCPVQV